MAELIDRRHYEAMADRCEKAEARIAELEKALRYYADPKKWQEFQITTGAVFNGLEGDFAFAFDADDDNPWHVAANVL